MRHNTSKTQPNASTKEARAEKIELYFALFATKLYFFLISFRNSWCSLTCKDLASLQNARGIVESKSDRNRKIQSPKGKRPFKMPDVLRKIKWPTENKTQDCNSGTKVAHIHPPSCFINDHYRLWKITICHQAKVTQKVRKKVSNIKMYFNQFFILLERTSTFIIFLFRVIYRSSSPDVFTKNGVLLLLRSIATE